MKIYTKTGDDGTTGLFGGERVSKSAVRIEAYGTVDELNAVLGLAVFHVQDKHLKDLLLELQHDLFILGADLATSSSASSDRVQRISPEAVVRIEKMIDELEDNLEPLKNFILPGGGRGASYLHLARNVCRRGERLIVKLASEETIGSTVVQYVNRLSDFLFVLARYSNHVEGIPDIIWKKKE